MRVLPIYHDELTGRSDEKEPVGLTTVIRYVGI